MFYYVAKFLEASGLGLLAYAFLKTFPDKLNYRVLGISILLFFSGWIMEKYLLKK
jgi:hypothetical protein